MMNDSSEAEAPGAFEFKGTWQEFAPIAFTNLLLTIVTLGIYSFWARARERRYLWSRTRFIDERLEWTGTGLELFVGYLLAMALVIIPFSLLSLGMQGLILRGHNGAFGAAFALFYFFALYLVGIAIFRAVRYRLSRTFWHGIRGGSDDQGFAFGWQYLWRTIVGVLAFGIMVPWSMTSLWNRRWNAMSFGPYRFTAQADWNRIIGRYLMFYLLPIVMFVGIFAMGAMAVTTGGETATATAIILGVIFILGFYVGLGLVAMWFYAAYFREVVGKLTLGDLSFSFEARTKDWLLLMLGNIGLVIVTLGIGYIFIGYRNWSFFVRHMRGYGELHLDDMTQSTTKLPGQGEGLLDAFDIGAI